MKSIFKNGVKILVAAVTLLALVPNGIVHASSIYDSTVIPAYEWKVVDRDGNSHDTDLAQAINNVSDPQLKTQCQAVYAKFMQMDYRSYDVQHPSRYSAENYARVFGSDEAPGDTQWATSGDLKYAYSLWRNYVGIQLKYDSDANKVVAFDCGDGTNGGSANITYAVAADDGFMIEREYITQNFEVTYPVGYDGESIPSGIIGGQISGNVQCANTNNVISAVHINPQSGLDGNAKITQNN